MAVELSTNAERMADLTRNLPSFKKLSLPGIKEQAAQILNLIGRDGIFSTYTVHDITHIDAMLGMLDWLVPDSTKSAMSPVDWLLTVLAIYLHDLGMVTTAREYDERLKNPEFVDWRESLDKTSEGREYLARTNRMTPQERERFFFQEFIRKGHPQRIREWITGRHSRTWGPHVQPIADRVADLLRDAPSRFRDYLAVACESHHRADLDRIDKYPLASRFGNDLNEIANVQYAAILLRTTDLLHITKDRTPSAMYQLIRFSDPKSVEEWDKQLGTFAVGPKGRKLVESDPETAIVVINADFTAERPLFSLQEYVAYADSEIRQSKRWADKSQESPDAKDYAFPWHRVDGDVRLEGVPPQAMRFELDRGRLLDLLVGHTIYNEPTVAVRELLQNGIDAVRFQRHLAAQEAKARGESPPPLGKVTVSWDPETRELIIQDNGIGMDRDTIRHHLMNVGSSYYNTPQFEAEHKDFVPISRFGIGILTCFMVSDDIEIVTYQKMRGHRIRMTSVKSTYLLRELEQGDKLLAGLEPHGTRVTLRLRDTVDLSERTILDIVRFWVILPECGVEYREPGKDPDKIGFASVAEALRSYHPSEDFTDQFNKLEFVVKSRSNSDLSLDPTLASYELAFGVYSGYFPERTFAHLKAVYPPRVCIEGIRVSGHLPGFERGDQNLSALLAVRGSRKFRTTVSRADLEDDDEYARVARLCAEMFVEHIHDEVARVSSKSGKPLSQAASGCRYLATSLRNAASRHFAEDELDELFELLPSIVMENVETTAERPIASRRLISPRALHDIPAFWTIESRAVDSLGMISLDLGRELSLNEFLLALAPDVTQLRYSPILPDAHWSLSAVLASHRPDRAEFSRQHQQTAITWTRRIGPDSAELDFFQLGTDAFQENLSDLLRSEDLYHSRNVTPRIRFESATISGDDARVRVISSRMGLVLQTGCDFAQAWHTIRNAALRVSQTGNANDMACILLIATALHDALSTAQRSERSYSRTREPHSIWREQLPRFRTILEGMNSKLDIPADLGDWVSQSVVFDATSYWRKWDRGADS